MKEKERREGGEGSSSGERARALILRLFCCTGQQSADEEKKVNVKEGERSSISFCKDRSATVDTTTDVSSGSVASLPPASAALQRPSLRPKLMRQSSRSESCLQNVWSRGCGGAAAPGSSLPPHMRALGGSTASLRRERGVRTRSCEAFRSGSLTRSSLKVREETDVLANIRKREMVSAIQGRKGSQRWKGQQEKEKRSGGGDRCKEGSPRVRLQRMVRASLRGSKKALPAWGESPFVRECLDWHNLLRARHGAAELKLCPALCAEAQTWANVLAHLNQFYHQNPPEFGENLLLWPLPILPPSSLAKKAPDVDGKYVATYWYRNHLDYPYHKPPPVLHSYASPFTQLVWGATQKFGCGKARNSNGKVVVVAYYWPRGNRPDQFHSEVTPHVAPGEVAAGHEKTVKAQN